MRNNFLIPILVLVFLLAACGGETQTQVSEDAVQKIDAAPEAVDAETLPTETPIQVTEEVAEEPVPVEFASECTLVSSPMDPETPYADLFAVTERDWVIGPETAALTIVEYGDYQ